MFAEIKWFFSQPHYNSQWSLSSFLFTCKYYGMTPLGLLMCSNFIPGKRRKKRKINEKIVLFEIIFHAYDFSSKKCEEEKKKLAQANAEYQRRSTKNHPTNF